MRVEDVMSRTPVTVSPGTALKEAARLLVEHGISGLPVVDDEARVVGVVSEGDIVGKEQGAAPRQGRVYSWLYGERRSDARTAGEAMTEPAVVIEPGRPVAEAAREMVARSVNRLPVVSEGKLVGIVTRADLVRAFIRSDEEIEREIREDVLLHTLWIDPTGVLTSVSDGEVTVEGTVDNRTDAELIVSFVARVPGVVSVDDSRLLWRYDDIGRRRPGAA